MSAPGPEPDPPQQSRGRALLGLVALVIAVAAVLLVVHELQQSARMQDCVASGRTNCAPITPDR